MSVLTETIALSNGDRIPRIGFGTWLLDEGDECYNAVADALRLGYRHIDTARAYRNEASVGRAVRDSGIPREQIYVTSKLPAEAKDYETAIADIAVRYGVSAPQLCIRYLLQKGAVVLPKATTTAHIEQNAQLDFEISTADMGILDAMRDTDKHDDAMEVRWS